MSHHAPVFRVRVSAAGVTLEKIKRKHPGYRGARKRAILRQRDAIELFRALKAGGAHAGGSHDFHFLETARTFAMLRLQAREAAVQDNLDRILAYDGSAST